MNDRDHLTTLLDDICINNKIKSLKKDSEKCGIQKTLYMT